MRAIYWLRVIVFSIEAFLLLAAYLAWTNLQADLASIAGRLTLNEELLKYLILLPLGLGGWVATELVHLLHEDKETTRILSAWSDYWKLKVHVWVSLLYAVLFSFLSIAPWLVKSGVSSAGGLLLFFISIAGQLVVAASVYVARLQVKESIANAQ